jgi:hypothetical protein
MPQIDLRENKVLKLLNVLSRKIPEQELFSHDKQLQILLNWIKAKGYESVGPLIVYTSTVSGIDADGKPQIESRIMQQIKQSNVRLELPYRFDSIIRIENCLMARICDKPEKLRYAATKLELHAYENDLELVGETYMVVIKQEGDKILTDVFMPIKTKK